MFGKLLDKIPENVVLIGFIVLFALIPICFGYFANTFEGFASITLLCLAIVVLLKYGKTFYPFKWNLIFPIIGFILLGIMFDGAGNFIYNKPIHNLFCPENTTLTRNVTTYENHEGDDVAVHNFSCYSLESGQNIKAIPSYYSSGIRLFEYLLIGFGLFGINFVVLWFSRLIKKKSELKNNKNIS